MFTSTTQFLKKIKIKKAYLPPTWSLIAVLSRNPIERVY